jgi:hypothetical protein
MGVDHGRAPQSDSRRKRGQGGIGMNTEIHGSPGWTIAQAIERVVDPELRGLLAQRERERKSAEHARANAPGWVGSGSLESGQLAIQGEREARQRENDARAAVYNTLREIMRTGKLIARGRKGGGESPIETIPGDAWITYPAIITSPGRSALHDDNGKPGFLGVTIFPPLLAPSAADIIARKSLRMILREHVLNDPEIAVLAGRSAPDSQPGQGLAIGGNDPILIPITGDLEEICTALGDAISPGVLAKATAERLAALFRLLRTGSIVAAGMEAGQDTGQLITITGDVFRRESTRTCLVSGDVWSEPAGQAAKKLFRDVEITAPIKKPNSDISEKEAEAKDKGGRPSDKFWPTVFSDVIAEKLDRILTKREIPKSAFAKDMKAFIDDMASHAEILKDDETAGWRDRKDENLPAGAERFLKKDENKSFRDFLTGKYQPR